MFRMFVTPNVKFDIEIDFNLCYYRLAWTCQYFAVYQYQVLCTMVVSKQMQCENNMDDNNGLFVIQYIETCTTFKRKMG